MIQLKNVLVVTVLLASLLSLNSCKKEEVEIEQPIEKIYNYKEMIGGIIPKESSVGIDVRVNPVISFSNRDVNYAFYYKIKVDTIILYQENEVMGLSYSMDNMGQSLVIVPDVYFKPNSDIRIFAKFHYEFNDGDQLIKPDPLYSEEIESTFHTLVLASDTIMESNVAYTYPFHNQYHYLQNEYRKGFFQFIASQEELFEVGSSNSESIFIARVTNKDGYYYQSSIVYHPESDYIDFDMPNDMENEKIYKLEIVKINPPVGKVLYSYYFRTSMYNNASEKLSHYNARYNRYFDNIIQLVCDGRNGLIDEYLDVYEGMKGFGLFRIELDESTPFYAETIYPIIYQNITKTDLSPIENRSHFLIPDSIVAKYNLDVMEFVDYPPLNCVSTYNYTPFILTKDQIEMDNAERIEKIFIFFQLELEKIANWDYYRITKWITSKYPNNDYPEWCDYFVENLYKHFFSPRGEYKFIRKYTLPNGITTYQDSVSIRY